MTFERSTPIETEDVHELRRDAEASAGHTDTSREHERDAQLAGDLGRRLARAAILHRRVARDDTQPLHPREVRDDLVCQAVADVLVNRGPCSDPRTAAPPPTAPRAGRSRCCLPRRPEPRSRPTHEQGKAFCRHPVRQRVLRIESHAQRRSGRPELLRVEAGHHGSHGQAKALDGQVACLRKGQLA